MESDGFGVLTQMVIKGLEGLRADEAEPCGLAEGDPSS